MHSLVTFQDSKEEEKIPFTHFSSSSFVSDRCAYARAATTFLGLKLENTSFLTIVIDPFQTRFITTFIAPTVTNTISFNSVAVIAD